MAISEQKMKIVIENYFKAECNVNTSIREAFEKGFRIGAEKASSAQTEIIRCKDCIYQTESWSEIKYCEAHGDHIGKDYDYCSNARRKDDE